MTEELEELASDIQDAKDRHTRDTASIDHKNKDDALETRLINLLKQHSGVYFYLAMLAQLLKRPIDTRPSTAPPLLLLDREDLLDELRYQADRARDADAQVDQRISELRDDLQPGRVIHVNEHVFKD